MPNRGVGNARLNDIHASAAESQIHDTSTNDAVSNVQLTASEATRAQISLKARKRTKTGCLSGFLPLYLSMTVAKSFQPVGNGGSSAERNDRLAPIVSSQNVAVKAMLPASSSKTL